MSVSGLAVAQVWTRTFGGSEGDLGYSVQQTADGGYVVAGYTSSYGAGSEDIYLIKTDAQGDTLWTRTFGGAYNDYGRSVQQTADGGYVVAGFTASFGAGEADVWLLRLGGDLGTDSPSAEGGLPTEFALRQNYPNPFNPITTLRYDLPERSRVVLAIYDILGREVSTLVKGVEEPGYKSVSWDGTDEFGRPSGTGIYLYQIQAADFVQTRKMLLLK